MKEKDYKKNKKIKEQIARAKDKDFIQDYNPTRNTEATAMVTRFSKDEDNENTNVVLSGGGCLNSTLYKDLSVLFGKENICTSREHGIDPMYKEAILMLALGISRIKGLSSNIPLVWSACSWV